MTATRPATDTRKPRPPRDADHAIALLAAARDRLTPSQRAQLRAVADYGFDVRPADVRPADVRPADVRAAEVAR